MSREGVPIVVIQRQLGHADLGVTSVYLRGIENTEIIDTVHARRAPMMPATAGLLIGRYQSSARRSSTNPCRGLQVCRACPLHPVRMPDQVIELLITEMALDKLGARNISAEEVEQLLRNDHTTVRNPRAPEPDSRRLLIGRIDGGRRLTLVSSRRSTRQRGW
jgi:hypothetical protein